MNQSTSSLKLSILFLPGDGIGEETSAKLPGFIKKLLDIYNKRSTEPDLSLEFCVSPLGTSALLSHGAQIPAITRERLALYPLAIKGPTRTPDLKNDAEINSIWQNWYSNMSREECIIEIKKMTSANVGLRKLLNLYACKRPVFHYPGVPTNFKKPDAVNFTVFRENTEGLYGNPNISPETSKALIDYLKLNAEFASIATQLEKDSDFVLGFGVCSKNATKRIMRAAMQQAIKEGKKMVTIAHKANILRSFSGYFKLWCEELVKEEFADVAIVNDYKVSRKDAYSQDKIIVDNIIIDNCCEKSVTNPGIYDILVMENLMGDIFTDLAAGLVGGLGVAPGTNINYETGAAVYEAVHGTADDIAGQNKVNPCSELFSLLMLFDDQGGQWSDFSRSVEIAVETTFVKGEMTGDLAKQISEDHPKLSFTDFLLAIEKNY